MSYRDIEEMMAKRGVQWSSCYLHQNLPLDPLPITDEADCEPSLTLWNGAEFI